MMEFPFEKKFSKKLGTLLDPIIPVTITGPRRKVRIAMLLSYQCDKAKPPPSEILSARTKATSRLPTIRSRYW